MTDLCFVIVCSHGGVNDAQPVGEATANFLRPSWMRPTAMSVYAVAVGFWIVFVGLPTDPFQIFVWFWLASIAWYAGDRRRYLDFPRDWWPTFAVLIAYLYSRGLSDNVIGMPVHYDLALNTDRWLVHTFTGHDTLPTVFLQAHLCGSPCLASSPAHWYDLVLSTVYFSHFVVGLVIALVLWIRDRTDWIAWLTRYLAMNIAGLAVYILYPAAPPWMASRDGLIAEHVPRMAARGWNMIGLGGFHVLLAKVGNPVAAMPSLHGGIAMLVAMWTIRRLRSPWRWLILIYPFTMAFGLVYFGEHYVTDILAGWLLAGAVMWAVDRWEQRRVGAQVAELEPPFSVAG